MRHQWIRLFIPVWALIILIWSGSMLPASAADNLDADIERLLLNHKQLTIIHDDLHTQTIASFQGAEAQSGYIRQANLFISESNLICYYQWRLLSVLSYIKATHRKDFHTLRVRDLEMAITESEHRVVLLNLYSAYIQDEATRKIIDQAIGIIEGNVYLFSNLQEKLTPLAQSSERFSAEAIAPDTRSP